MKEKNPSVWIINYHPRISLSATIQQYLRMVIKKEKPFLDLVGRLTTTKLSL